METKSFWRYVKELFTSKNKLILGILLLSFTGWTIERGTKVGDFAVFLDAAKKIWNGVNPYWVPYGPNHNNMVMFNSPFLGFVLIPFTLLPSWITCAIWQLANIYFVYRIWMFIRTHLEIEFETTRYRLFIFASFFVVARFIVDTFAMVQLNLFVIYSITEGVWLIERKRERWGGLILALGILIKTMPIIILPYLIYRKRWKTGLYILVLVFGFALLPMVVTGPAFYADLMRGWAHISNPLGTYHTFGETETGPHALSALIPTLLMDTQGDIPWKRNILDLDPFQVKLILNIARAFLIALTPFFLRLPPFKDFQSKRQTLQELSYILLIMPLIFPHQQKYAFSALLPAVAFIFYQLVTEYKPTFSIHSKRGYWAGAFTLLAVIPLAFTADGLVGKRLGDIAQHYRLITYGALLLIPPLFLLRNQRLVQAPGVP